MRICRWKIVPTMQRDARKAVWQRSISWWWRPVAWTFAVVAIILATVVVLLYGMEFHEQSLRKWLTAVVIALAFGLLIASTLIVAFKFQFLHSMERQSVCILVGLFQLLAVFLVLCLIRAPLNDDDTEGKRGSVHSWPR